MSESSEVFVLTVLRDNVLDACETFMQQQDALQSGIYFCEMANIDVSRSPVYDAKMKGWLISDSYGYFVSVVRRSVHHTSYMVGSSYGTFLDAIAGRGFARRGGGYGLVVNTPPIDLQPARVLDGYTSIVTQPHVYVKPLVQAPPTLPVQSVVQAIPVSKDDPWDDKLPGGFGLDDKPKTMADMKSLPLDLKFTYELSEEQKWALILARTKHRPDQVILIKGHSLVWNQHHMLTELSKRTPLGLQMRDQELAELDRFHQDACDDHYDESSSSSEESSYD